MSRTVLFFLLSLPASLAGPGAWAQTGPPAGVYGCYDAKMDYKMQLVITPMPFVMFAIVDDSTYADYDGHEGHYAYDAGAGVLTMTDGSRQGWRYHKAGDWSFRLISNTDGTEIYTCPLNAGQDPRQRPW